ncbi:MULTISPECIES: hypothetical protein [unclassified Frondihabitans]|uniref:hypothetical protein n=1 Tax=unclassified Frondihabitans TaxID=2626248 RepID=UPI000F505B96|nr:MULTISPECIES: hypothetical protein [unclassified Frondihabitans]RPE78957.1 hypothetical protein EDF37_1645 [Frondihabitans sp. PhB153]RPF09238.1 hypothetical protein EDF39_1647 [Frondihabitans sp. PhB161]
MTENDNKPEEDNMTNSSTAGSAGAPRDPKQFRGSEPWGRHHRVEGFRASFAITITETETVCWVGTVKQLWTEGRPETGPFAFIGLNQKGDYVATTDPARAPRTTVVIHGLGKDPIALTMAAIGLAKDAHRLNKWNVNIDLRRWIATLPGWRPERYERATMIFQLWFLGGISERWAPPKAPEGAPETFE